MKSILGLTMGLVIALFARAQDTAVVLRADMYTPVNELLIGTMDGWYFSPGKDSAAGTGTAHWKKLKPIELNAAMADASGRLEGWLRFRFRQDSSFQNADAVGFRYAGWAAADIYVNDQLVQTYGNTGVNGLPYRDFNPSNQPLPAYDFLPGKDYVFSIHFVDYVSRFPLPKLKSDDYRLHAFIKLVGPAYRKRFTEHIAVWPIYLTVWITVFVVLTLLFWFLVLLNPREKIFPLLAVTITVGGLLNIAVFFYESNTFPYTIHKIGQAGQMTLAATSAGLTAMVASMVFRGRILRWLWYLLAIDLLIALVGVVNNLMEVVGLTNLLSIFVYAWFIVSSWKKLKGAQWAVVAGLFCSLLLTLTWMICVFYYRTVFIPAAMLITSGMTLVFPLSLVVYTALRFKEIINEVRNNAEKVVQLSEEKRDQAERQQEVLQKEVQRQTIELRSSLEHLRSTQSQLIQSEKMASLGELTAGIAHEIQNPLNFVNNFSELNNELIAELKEELVKNNIAEARQIASSIGDNSEKINHHGKRADSIVKGMLQHSRSSGGQKELTDINALCDEYLRLAYHGLRAKDKSFNALFETDLDASVGKLNVQPQEIGRVVLNLINNAFYSVNEKKKQVQDGYQPRVTVRTKKDNDAINIMVEDNGTGIPQKVLGKIFQPFFTTKPTGQGTGLGLSLSYDIVKAHGGELSAMNGDEGAIFRIKLPNS